MATFDGDKAAKLLLGEEKKEVDNVLNEGTKDDLKKMSNQLEKMSDKLVKIADKDKDLMPIQMNKLKEQATILYNLHQTLGKFFKK